MDTEHPDPPQLALASKLLLYVCFSMCHFPEESKGGGGLTGKVDEEEGAGELTAFAVEVAPLPYTAEDISSARRLDALPCELVVLEPALHHIAARRHRLALSLSLPIDEPSLGVRTSMVSHPFTWRDAH